MKLMICTVLVALMAASVIADICTYNYCVKDELHVCTSNITDRIECNRLNGLYITFKRGTLYPSEHTCCRGWRMDNLRDHGLWCVRNARDATTKCTSQEQKDFKFQYASKCKGHNFSCQ